MQEITSEKDLMWMKIVFWVTFKWTGDRCSPLAEWEVDVLHQLRVQVTDPAHVCENFPFTCRWRR